MIKKIGAITWILFLSVVGFAQKSNISIVVAPKIEVSGAMKNIMMKVHLSAHINMDTLSRYNLYGLGPVNGLKGEILILNGKVYSTSKSGAQLVNGQDKVSLASMLVYSYVSKWRPVRISTVVNNYAELEKFIETTAKANLYNTDKPFAFKIDVTPGKANFHVIDWKESTSHTMENHKQFAYTGQVLNKKVVMLGFYSTHHQSIFTHHTSSMHIHLLNQETNTVGHLDDIQIKGLVTIYFPEN